MAKKILIIEDDSFLQGLASRKLGSEGYDVAIALDGEQAMKSLAESKPDLILLDLLLPGIDGYEVLKRVRADKDMGKIPVIVFSNLSEEKDIKKATDLGINAFLIKANFTLDELSAKIKEVLG
jgi:DNA-binding response OmpR family regulator